MTALTEKQAVEARLGRVLTAAESARVEALLEDASAIVVGYCRSAFADAVPGPVAGVVAKMVARVIGASQASGGLPVQQQTAGPFSVAFPTAVTSGDMWLTNADKLALKPHRMSMVSVPLHGVRTAVEE